MLKVVIFVFSSLLVGCGWAKNFSFPIQHWQTKHSIPVFFVERHEIPMLDVAVVLDAGSARDGKDYGVAAMTASMLEEGADGMSASAIARAFDDVGASYSAATSRDMTVLSLRCLTETEYRTSALAFFVKLLSKPSFELKAFNRSKNQRLDAIRQSQQSPGTVASWRFYEALYGEQPYGHPVIGTLDSVATLTPEKLKNFFKQFYVRQNAKIVLVGDLSVDAAKIIAEQIDASLASGKAPAKLAIAVAEHKNHSYFVPLPVNQNAIIIGQLGITWKNPYYFDLQVANHVLGGHSMLSLLFEQVRNRQGLAYAVYSDFSPLALQGPFRVSVMTRFDQTKKALDTVNGVIKNFVTQGPTKKQLATSKKNLLASFPLFIASNQKALANVVNIAFYDLPLDYLTGYPQQIEKVTESSVRAAMAQTFKPQEFITVIAGKK